MISLYNCIKAYQENKSLINAYLKKESIENFNGDGDNSGGTKILGFEIGFFLLILAISIGLWIWAIVALVKYWKFLPSWAKVLGIIGVLPILPGGPIVTLLCVYIGKQN